MFRNRRTRLGFPKQVSAFAQHYIECANCEEQPAQFICKTCPGNLCEVCRTEHLRRKISRNHTVVRLTGDETRKPEFPNCPEHTDRKLECYCTFCKTPACMTCMMGSHNGHKVDNLQMVFEKIRRKREKAKEEIESLLPLYRRMLMEEKMKNTELVSNTGIIRNKIEEHADRIVQTVMNTKTKAIQTLKSDTQNAFKIVKATQKILSDRTELLEKIYADIKSKLTTPISVEYFQEGKLSSLAELYTFPERYTISVKSFMPGNVDISKIFGDINNFVLISAKRNSPQKIRITEKEVKKCALFGINKKCEKSWESEDFDQPGIDNRKRDSFRYRPRLKSL